MSDAKPKRAPREPMRGKTAARGASPAKPIETATSAPETATAAVALATAAQPIAAATPELTATVAEAMAEPPLAEPNRAEPKPTRAAPDAFPSVERLWADPWSAMTEAQSALARGFEAAVTEVGDLTRSGFAATTEAATAMLGAKTFAEAIEINAGYARRGFDAMLGGAAKLSEIGVKAATDASRPILSRLGESWKSLGGH